METLYHTVQDKWEPLGIYLHIPMAILQAIAIRHQHDSQHCLKEVLEIWVKRVHPPTTWAAVIQAVEFLEEEQLGRKLREKY